MATEDKNKRLLENIFYASDWAAYYQEKADGWKDILLEYQEELLGKDGGEGGIRTHDQRQKPNYNNGL